MGYLDNTTIIVDAVLTKKGREALARQDGSFRITQFALGDDEIDYSLYNENHSNGSAYAGEAIENLPMIEAIPDENAILKSKLVTLLPGTSTMPVVSAGTSKISLALGGEFTLKHLISVDYLPNVNQVVILPLLQTEDYSKVSLQQLIQVDKVVNQLIPT